jgi:CO dehydrogenase nickel-insertion accessory protein CooC1
LVEGGVRKTAEEFEKEFLGEIPINPEVGKMEMKESLLLKLILNTKFQKFI